ncbi:DUF2975 domain-containing protein [Pinirhizobacter soli]|uniref:DUF2975 domain-containing protein n=1 Tax=Pinirhizobacter soli TaxID=2786953 RepID=UPI00202A4FEE|nr:DUF2975 domain-containing protein [Pinirhizobacter soli]
MESDIVVRRARVLRYVLVLAMLAVVVANAWLWWRGAGSYGTGWVSIYSEWPTDLHGHAWVQLLAASLASALLLGGLYRLCRLMRLFEAGEFFSMASTRHLRGFALSLIGAVTVNTLVPPLLMLGLRLAGKTDVQAISLQMDSSDLWTLLVGALFFLITSLMVEARRLADDSAQII